MAFAIAEEHTPNRHAISALAIPNSRIKWCEILTRTTEIFLARTPTPNSCSETLFFQHTSLINLST
jgi:hypothetical protein